MSTAAAIATTPAPSTAPVSPSATPVAVRFAAEHKVDLSLVKAGRGDKIQKEDVLAYLDGQKQMLPAAPGRILASPKARRLAQVAQLDLAALNGSGPTGAVLAADVLAAEQRKGTQPTAVQSSAPPPTPLPLAPANSLPISRAWRIMAQRLQQSWTSVPHFYLEREANASELVRWRASLQTRSDAKITYTDLLMKLVALALRKHPRLNASWLDENIVMNEAINIGLAVAVEEGLLVPVLHGADGLGLGEIAARRTALVQRAQSGKLKLDDLSYGTFTISNLGMYGIDAFNAIVNPPQAAILAVGRITDRVVPLNGQPAVQPMTTLTLSCDHRVVDGARAAQFVQTLVGYIENPLSVLE